MSGSPAADDAAPPVCRSGLGGAVAWRGGGGPTLGRGCAAHEAMSPTAKTSGCDSDCRQSLMAMNPAASAGGVKRGGGRGGGGTLSLSQPK